VPFNRTETGTDRNGADRGKNPALSQRARQGWGNPVKTFAKEWASPQSPQVGIAQSYLSFRNHALHANWDKIERESIHSAGGPFKPAFGLSGHSSLPVLPDSSTDFHVGAAAGFLDGA